MKSKELIKELAKRMEWTTQEVTDTMVLLSSIVSTRLVDTDSVYLQKLGQFEVRKKAERISVNPVNGKRYLVPPKLVPVFKPGATVKAKLKELDNKELDNNE
ncbi:HU family DNA-binding protein [Parabacteroides sp. PF5-9]|uniref:HU family DNA-binding protein n=1 Tax=Parabacteroides sp. PF5-9 TaxID=1742404 RepID=UPI002475FCA2|nr:HU family DNA-binding protein [Parabacteroides sp. PF5-9]MDH6358296.1 DNA-binding protein HU-beta [Parabacteroides sp. PF5-9]